MAKYRLYAGLSGGFGGAVYQGTEEFKSQQEAEWRAYDIAWEEYESYGGNHGLLDWDACYEDALDAEWIDPHSQTQEEIERIVDDHYRELVEGWIVYKAVLVTEPGIDPDCDDDYYNDDDADCYTDD